MRVWNARSWQVVYEEGGAPRARVSFSPDGRGLAQASPEGAERVRILRLPSFELVGVWGSSEPGPRLVDIAYAPDGATLYVALEDGTLHVLAAS